MRRDLGRSGIEVSAVGMGCWAIGGPFWDGETPLGWGEVDDQESIRAVHAALDRGVDFFDTANVYGAGHSERVLGQAVAGRRPQVVIATKFSSVFDETTRQVTGSDATPGGIRAACEDSLRRLNTDYIDLYQFHDNGYPAEKAAPVRETLEQLVLELPPRVEDREDGHGIAIDAVDETIRPDHELPPGAHLEAGQLGDHAATRRAGFERGGTSFDPPQHALGNLLGIQREEADDLLEVADRDLGPLDAEAAPSHPGQSARSPFAPGGRPLPVSPCGPARRPPLPVPAL